MRVFRAIVFMFFIFCGALSAKNIEYAKILYAFDLNERGDNVRAGDEMLELYESSKAPVYLKQALMFYSISDSPKFKQLIMSVIQKDPSLKDDKDYFNMLITFYIKEQKLDKAEQLVRNRMKKRDDVDMTRTLIKIKILKGENDAALSMLKELYKKDKSKETGALLVQSFSLFELKEAMPLIEDYYKNRDCYEEHTCEMIANAMIRHNEFKKAMKIYDRLIASGVDIQTDYILDELLSNGLYNEALSVLDKYHGDEDSLEYLIIRAHIYANLGRIREASELYGLAFKSTGNPEFLAQEARLEYEANIQMMSKEGLKQIADKFERAIILGAKEPVIFNDYGYLLIDYDLDVKKGIELVSNALKLEPEQPYYLDSLAWGYFKLNECKKARELMLRAFKSSQGFEQNAEAKAHIKKIDECINKGQK